MRKEPLKIGFIGVGAMGAMLVRALVRSDSVSAGNIWIANRSPAKLEALAAECPGLNYADAEAIAAETQILFLCVKPGDTRTLLEQIETRLRHDHICVFLTNVFSFQQLEARVACRVAKLIPSVTQELNRGVALLACGTRLGAADSATLQNLLGRICTLRVVLEDQLRALADVASCGPAFVSACIEEICRQAAGRTRNLSARQLQETAIETLTATAELLRSGISPQELVRQVAVPGGMTDAGLQVLRGRLPEMIAAVFEATDQAERKKKVAISLDHGS
ncbi:MAG TPA: pyrroline-5-carboxylate reductase dimerization domain-containing protein [Candidatus Angelobacter sp.]